MTRMHDDEIDIDEDLVRRLVDGLSADYAALPLRRFEATGSSNALFRLGPDLLVRLPRQPGGTATIEKEHRWLPYVAPHLPVATPEILAVGEPTDDYPEKWSVVRYLPGSQPAVPTSDEAPRHALAHDLAAVVDSLARLPVPDRAAGDRELQWYRGRPLATMDDDMRGYLRDARRLEHLDLDLDAVTRAWEATIRVPGAGRVRTPHWYHGDLNPENLLVRDGRLTAVLDFGGLAVGDPTIDLTVAWQLLDPDARDTFRTALGVDDVTWCVARGWSLVLALMGLPYYWDTMPERCARSVALARVVLADVATA